AIAPLAAAHGLDVVTLHGDQPLDAQERALRPGPRRRVVLATNVAETALTVEGVTAVIDSGLARVARLDPRHGITVLRVTPIGRRMLELPAEPRLARLLVEAERTGSAAEGALLAALASERDILAAGRSFGSSTTADFPPGPSDLELRARLFEDAARHRFAA